MSLVVVDLLLPLIYFPNSNENNPQTLNLERFLLAVLGGRFALAEGFEDVLRVELDGYLDFPGNVVVGVLYFEPLFFGGGGRG